MPHFHFSLKSIAFLACILISTVSFADVLPSGNFQTSINTMAGKDYLSLNPANSAGISFNDFSRFNITDRDLNIIQNNTLVGSPQFARTIVIYATSINITKSLTLLGPTTNVIFIAPKTGSINCHECKLNNFHRASFVTINQPYNANTLNSFINNAGLNNIIIDSTASVKIDSLSAPGITQLDIVASNIDLSGTINTHQKADKNASGAYFSSEQGGYTIGAGIVNIVSGENRWHYNENKAFIVNNNSANVGVSKAKITSAEIKIFASNAFNIENTLSTYVDVVASTRKFNQVFIPTGNINIAYVSNNALNITKAMNANGALTLSAKTSINIHPNTQLNAKTMVFIAGENMINNGIINADRNIDIGVYKLYNHGDIESNTQLNVLTENVLHNQFGGNLIADAIQLESKNAYILNGSRTPYKDTPQDNGVVLLEFFKNSESLAQRKNYYSLISPLNMGTYYNKNLAFKSTASLSEKPINQSAKIIGNSIVIEAKAFENINPVYIKTDDSQLVEKLDTYAHQVAIEAEELIKITALDYVLNSSSLMRVNNPKAEIILDTQNVINERYRLETHLDYSSATSSTMPSGTAGQNTTSVRQNIFTEMVSVSPPASIVSVGSVFIRREKDFLPKASVFNVASYMEVYNNLILDVNSFYDVGYNHKKFSRTLGSSTNFGYSAQTGLGYTSGISGVNHSVSEFDSFLYVGKSVFSDSEQSESFYNASPLDSYVQKIVDDYMQKNFTTEVTSSYFGGGSILKGIMTYDIDIDYNSDTVSVNWQRHISKSTCLLCPSESDKEVGTESFGIFDKLFDLYNTLQDSFVSFWNELDWW